MGGRAFEDLARQGRFECVLDFATQEVGNHHFGSRVSAGADRLTNAGRASIPQIVAPGCYDLVDIVGWEEMDPRWTGNETHAHNRLISSVILTADQRQEVARAHAEKLAQAKGKTAFVMPLAGCNEWDRDGAPLHDAAGLAAFTEAMKDSLPANAEWHPIEGHINDPAFCEKVLGIFDTWMGTTAPA
jgi:uncharacterized protein (UPF0261 family)